MLPEYQHLGDVIRVLDVGMLSEGRVLRVLMNSELDEAIAYLAEPDEERSREPRKRPGAQPARSEVYWRWRMRIAEQIAAEIDPDRFGVRAVYLIGSTKNATAGPSSDIDLVVHTDSDASKRAALEAWLEGWSRCLAELNYQRTGYRTGPLLDVHMVTDEDVDRRTSYAAKIGAVTDPALELEVGTKSNG
jgi:predicted nucleotidyltransferase